MARRRVPDGEAVGSWAGPGIWAKHIASPDTTPAKTPPQVHRQALVLTQNSRPTPAVPDAAGTRPYGRTHSFIMIFKRNIQRLTNNTKTTTRFHYRPCTLPFSSTGWF